MSDNEGVLRLLEAFGAGRLNMNLNGKPLAMIDGDSKSVEVDLSGLGEVGVKLSELLRFVTPQSKEGRSGFSLFSSERIARGLAERGWNFSLYDRGERLIAVGRGVSRLTGHISFNPLKIRKILDSMR